MRIYVQEFEKKYCVGRVIGDNKVIVFEIGERGNKGSIEISLDEDGIKVRGSNALVIEPDVSNAIRIKVKERF